MWGKIRGGGSLAPQAPDERRLCKDPEPVPKPGTRNRFLNIVSLTHCIICVYESLFVNNEGRNTASN